MKKEKKGFTLIELLVVIAIIGLLATLSVVALNNVRERARDSRRMSDIKQIQTALELYYNANDGYPDRGTLGTTYVGMDNTDLKNDLGDFIDPLPDSPTPGDGNCTVEDLASVTNGFKYAYASDGDTYELMYCLGDGGTITATESTIGIE